MLCFLTKSYQDLFLVSYLHVSNTLKRVRLLLCIKNKRALGLSRLPFENFLKKKKLNPCTDSSKVTFL